MVNTAVCQNESALIFQQHHYRNSAGGALSRRQTYDRFSLFNTPTDKK